MLVPARVMLFGPRALYRECLASMLDGVERFTVTAHTGDPERTLERLREDPPDVLVVDLDDSADGHRELIQRARREQPGVRVMVLGTRDARDVVLECIEVGVSACASKEDCLDELCRTLDRVLGGEVVYSPQIAYSMFTRLAELARERSRRERIEALKLTPRELETLELIAGGLSNRKIAERLSLSVYTVKNHVHHILRKLEVRDRRQAVEHAYARRWLRCRRGAPRPTDG